MVARVEWEASGVAGCGGQMAKYLHWLVGEKAPREHCAAPPPPRATCEEQPRAHRDAVTPATRGRDGRGEAIAGMQAGRRAYRRAGMQAGRRAYRRAGIQAGGQADRRTGRQAGRQLLGSPCWVPEFCSSVLQFNSEVQF